MKISLIVILSVLLVGCSSKVPEHENTNATKAEDVHNARPDEDSALSDEDKKQIKYERWSKVVGGQFWSFSTEEYEVVKKDFDIVRGMGGRWFTSRRLLREGYNITREEMVERIIQSFEYYEWKQTKLRQGKYVLSAIYETSNNDLRFTRGPFTSNDSALEHIVTIHISDDASVIVIYGEVVW